MLYARDGEQMMEIANKSPLEILNQLAMPVVGLKR